VYLYKGATAHTHGRRDTRKQGQSRDTDKLGALRGRLPSVGDMKGGLEQEYKYTNWIQDVRSRWLGWHTQGSETEIVMQIDSMFPPVLVARLCAFIDQVARWYTAPEEFTSHDASPRYFRLDYILMSLRPSVQSLD
jgi:hypothetical protein